MVPVEGLGGNVHWPDAAIDAKTDKQSAIFSTAINFILGLRWGNQELGHSIPGRATSIETNYSGQISRKTMILETSRIILRELCPDDAKALARTLSDPETM